MAKGLTEAEVRLFMRDYASATTSGLTYVFNELLDHVEFTSAEIALAMDLTVSKFNVTSQITTHTFGDIEKYILMLGVCGFLMSSESFHQVRNQLTYNDGGEHHGYSDKYQAYRQLADNLRAEWDAIVPTYKVSLNLESAYASVPSAYAGFGYPSLVSSL